MRAVESLPPAEVCLTLPTARQLATEANAFDAELMGRVRTRDANALRALYDRHSSMVYGLGLKILKDPAEAEDLAQDVFLHLWRRADLFDGTRGAFLGWLVSLTRNRAIDRIRARKTTEKKADAYEAERLADVAPKGMDPNETAFVGELRGAVVKALGSLPEAQRTALELAYFGGLSHSEIAEQLETPLGTVKARIRQGMLRMRDLLGDFAAAGLIAGSEE
jgi:RNA polymerase sigma-70 factor (ECF subfamily)